MADIWVANAQTWINNTYGNVSGIATVTVDGSSGWQTMYALTRALQYELGITALSDNFGAGTTSAFQQKVRVISSTTTSRIVGILQCALWCKGYAGGTSFGQWSETVGASVSTVRSNLGLSAASTVDAKLMKSLLTMDAYTVVNGGSARVRSGQQWLNSMYSTRADFSLIPCDGLYTRDVQRGIVYAIQYESGMVDGTANGNFGPGTQQGLKSYGNLTSGATDGTRKFVSLFQIALAVNGYDVERSGTFAAATRTSTLDFQRFMELSASGAANFDTWAALLVSSGNVERSVTGMDTSTEITQARADQLWNLGYRVVGRYLTVTGKGLFLGELDRILNKGFKFFPIFQNFNNGPQYFYFSAGLDHGTQAARRLRQFAFPAGTTVFFSVDYDAIDAEIDSLIKPYFEGIRAGLATSRRVNYKVGIYATRNVSARMSQLGLADEIWVSGMSTGFSGNLGFPMPASWSYTQVVELHDINIDKNVVSSRAKPLSRSEVPSTPDDTNLSRTFWWSLVAQELLAEQAIGLRPVVPSALAGEYVLFFLMSRSYTGAMWENYLWFPERLATSATRDAVALTRGSYMQTAGNVVDLSGAYVGGVPADGGASSLEHMAATAQSVNYYGDHANSGKVDMGDLGGWALDFVQLWANARYRAADVSLASYVTTNLGGNTEATGFSLGDVIADADGWLLGSRLRSGLPFGEAVRQTLVIGSDWRLRVRAFLQGRFGATATSTQLLETNIRDVFTSSWPTTLVPRELFLRGADLPTASQLNEFATAAVNRYLVLAGLKAS
ncbi:glycoside hydrolase domain-containing protein [Frigoribacterium sp. PvP032]|uniref:glycoside hydrolase domain-containing protein n=1 Tax=Frigoribacterium sp. PvP032 TaxID=2806589 RepID=UPI001AE444FB|nr:glycoside hydrolase domain-containing protein [Frigoribacterium sp. PvP032]MBP1189205.1 peptidoglycan hydrolase-like protein with peptidoglycan-binding domain [Frigoribacterium sp. PvP032]